LPVNTIGPKVNLTPGSISTAVDRLVERDLVSRIESPEDRRVRVVSLTSKGKELIAPIFRKHTAEIRKVFADASPKELRALEATLKKIGKRADHRYESCPGEECKERSRLFGLNERTKSAPVFCNG
jgi:MarR family 2-MHQ and catechol resistance regulon transcriptional repressor